MYIPSDERVEIEQTTTFFSEAKFSAPDQVFEQKDVSRRLYELLESDSPWQISRMKITKCF